MITRFVGNPATVLNMKDGYINIGTEERPRFQPAAVFDATPIYSDCRVPINEIHFDWEQVKDLEHTCSEDSRCNSYALPSD